MIEKLKREVAELKAKLAKAMIKESFAATKTDKAILVHETEELNVGTEVFVEDEEGNRAPAEDGIYTLEDGKRVKVTEGKVEEILEAEEEAEAEETPVPNTAMADANAVTREEFSALAKSVTELATLLERFSVTVETVNEGIEARLAAVEQTPAGKTPAKEYKNEKVVTTGDTVLDRKLQNIRRFKK